MESTFIRGATNESDTNMQSLYKIYYIQILDEKFTGVMHDRNTNVGIDIIHTIPRTCEKRYTPPRPQAMPKDGLGPNKIERKGLIRKSQSALMEKERQRTPNRSKHFATTEP